MSLSASSGLILKLELESLSFFLPVCAHHCFIHFAAADYILHMMHNICPLKCQFEIINHISTLLMRHNWLWSYLPPLEKIIAKMFPLRGFLN